MKYSNSELISMKILQISGNKRNKEGKRAQQRKNTYKHQIMQKGSVFTLTEHNQLRPRHILTPSCAFVPQLAYL